MKAIPLILVVLLAALAGQAQPTFQQRLQSLPPRSLPPGAPPPDAAPAKAPANYLIRVEWRQPKGDPQSLEVLTTEGHFDLSTIQKTSVKINGSDIPTTLKFEGTLTALDDEKGRLQLFLGRTVPYVTGSSGSGPSVSSSYSQMSVGLDSTFLVKFDKPAVVQNDESGQITVLVKRMEI
jgi:hypothetical protein